MIDRHPRLWLAGVAVATYVFEAVSLFWFAQIWLNRDVTPHTRTVSNIVYALVVATSITAGQVYGRRKEMRGVALSSLDDWWSVSRCLMRGRAPREPRLWWAADDLVDRRTKVLRRSRAVVPVVLLAAVLFCVRATPDRPGSYAVAGVCVLAAIGLPLRTQLQLRRLEQAHAALQLCRPAPPDSFATPGR